MLHDFHLFWPLLAFPHACMHERRERGTGIIMQFRFSFTIPVWRLLKARVGVYCRLYLAVSLRYTVMLCMKYIHKHTRTEDAGFVLGQEISS